MRYTWSNPFSWKKQGDISGMVSAMSLSEPDGSALLLGDMPDYLEVSTSGVDPHPTKALLKQPGTHRIKHEPRVGR
jgi:hypothetical protein